MTQRIYIFLFLVQGHVVSFCQHSEVKPSLLGVNFCLTDFSTPVNIKSMGVGELFHPKIKSMQPGMSISYLRGFSDHVDVSVSAIGYFVDYPLKHKPPTGVSSLLLQLTSITNIKLNTDRKLFSPLISTGVGLSKYKNYYGLFVVAGLGIQLVYKKEFYIFISSNYSFAITDNVADNICYSLGFSGTLKKTKKKTRPFRLLYSLELPKQDRDGDNIYDFEDKCPTIPGLKKYFGCPIPDFDNDGINDEVDKCPQSGGLVRYQGCPIPDTDGDGINDEEDSCLTEPGPVNQHGCPIIDMTLVNNINTAAKNILFKTGSSNILPESNLYLDEIASILLTNPNYKIVIEGHTDNIGSDQSNVSLSEKRASAVALYLAAKGVEQRRMTYHGFGPKIPVAANETHEGRAKNRRVEIRLSF